MKKLGLVLASVFLVASCGGSEKKGDAPGSASVVVTAADGGEVELGRATLSIPRNALGADTTITVESTEPASSLPDGDSLQGLAYDFGPDGTTFTTPATLVLPVDSSPGDDHEVVVSWLDTTSNTWQDLATTFADGQATTQVSHFTTFIVRFKDAAGPVDCSYDACGGDIAGTWNIAGVCAELDDTDITGFCATATIGAEIDGTGTVTFNPDLTYGVNFTITGDLTIELPAACVSSQPSCEGLLGEAVCTGTPATGCTCTEAIDDVNSEQGTYATDGSAITFDNGEGAGDPASYCVDGNTLKVHVMEDGGSFTYTATKQQ